MKIHEENLKKIIKEIEKYGAIEDIRILNSSIIIKLPNPSSKMPCNSGLIEVDLNRAKKFEITFIMGDEKR